MFKVAIGHSDEIDSFDAINQVISQCIHELGGQSPQAGILFAAIEHDHNLILEKINKAFPDIELIGCTTDGEISSTLTFTEDSITLLLFITDEIDIKAGIGENLSRDPFVATSNAVNEAIAKTTKEIKLCITTPESLSTNNVTILEGLKQVLGQNFPIFGGIAGDQWQFKQTYQFYKDKVLSDSIPLLLFSGSVSFSSGIASGWAPIGQKSKISKSDKNIVYMIDNKRATDFYTYYLGEHITPSAEYPLVVYENTETNKYYLRAPLAYNEHEGSITFAGDVPLKATVQISHASRDDIIHAARQSTMKALDSFKGNEIAIVLIFSCAARKQLLGSRTVEEYKSLKNSINPEMKIFGFYAYGEICPLAETGQSQFHNETFVTLILGE